jgi:hypothetical protein
MRPPFDAITPCLICDFWYDGRFNRAVAARSCAVLEALRKVYGAQRLVDEIEPGGSGGG